MSTLTIMYLYGLGCFMTGFGLGMLYQPRR